MTPAPHPEQIIQILEREYIGREWKVRTVIQLYPVVPEEQERLIRFLPTRPTTSAELVVYEYHIRLPLKNLPSITRRKLALNDIGENEDGFCRLDFELKDGDVIQVLRAQRGRETE